MPPDATHGANQRLGVPRRRASRQTTAAGSSQLNGVRGLVRKFPMAEARMARTELDPVASRRLPFSPAARRLRLSPAPCMLVTMHFVVWPSVSGLALTDGEIHLLHPLLHFRK